MKLMNAKVFGLAALGLFPMLSGHCQTNPIPAPQPAAPAVAPATPVAPSSQGPANPSGIFPGPGVLNPDGTWNPSPGTSAPHELPPSASEVLKLSQAGMGDDVITAYINNSQAFFNLTANDILALKNAGLSSPVLAAMLSHDSNLRKQMQQAVAAPAPMTAPAVSPTPAPAPTVQTPTTPAPVVVEQAPPAPQVEVIPATPGVEFDWAPGYWSWRGGVWVWVGGTWVHRPHPGMVWVGGRWAPHGHGYIWVGGHWR